MELLSLIELKRMVRIVRINISVVYTELWVKELLSVIGLKRIVRRKKSIGISVWEVEQFKRPIACT